MKYWILNTQILFQTFSTISRSLFKLEQIYDLFLILYKMCLMFFEFYFEAHVDLAL